ncbi:MAG: cupredoxin domain-containing protein [Caulobacteraceae bacterium]
MARALGAASLAVAALVLTGAAAPAGASVRIVTIGGMAFAPAPEGLKVGDTVLWVNLDRFVHTVTARNGAFDVVLKPGDKAVTVLRQAGRIEFYCRFHPDMTGKLTVSLSVSPASPAPPR